MTAPIKKLTLSRQTVRTLTVKAGVQTGNLQPPGAYPTDTCTGTMKCSNVSGGRSMSIGAGGFTNDSIIIQQPPGDATV